MANCWESAMALIRADRLDDDRRSERERVDLLLLNDAKLGLADVESGMTTAADAAIALIQRHRATLNLDKTAHRRGLKTSSG